MLGAFHARFPVSVNFSCLRLAADQATGHTGEKTSGAQGRPTVKENKIECKLRKRVIRLHINFSKILLKFESKDISV